MLKDEGGMIDFQLFACQQTDEQMHIGDCRVTFTTEMIQMSTDPKRSDRYINLNYIIC